MTPDAVLQAVLDSLQAHHGDALPELDPHTRNTIREHVSGSSTGNSGAPSNTTPSASQNCNAP